MDGFGLDTKAVMITIRSSKMDVLIIVVFLVVEMESFSRISSVMMVTRTIVMLVFKGAFLRHVGMGTGDRTMAMSSVTMETMKTLIVV